MLNQVFHFWGHEWLYDWDEIVHLLVQAGFHPTRSNDAVFVTDDCRGLRTLTETFDKMKASMWKQLQVKNIRLP